jgi:2-methylcitrate dehydratase PrpD
MRGQAPGPEDRVDFPLRPASNVLLESVERLAQFAAHTRLPDIPQPVLARAKAIIADTVAVIAAGMQEPELKSLCGSHLPRVAAGPCAVIGAAQRANSLDAALLNGTAGVWQDFDEGNLFMHGHPGIQVIPAAIACAEDRRAAGADLLATVAVAYEACGRVGGASRMRQIIHPHGTFGTIGAAIAAARLGGSDPQRMRGLINLAASIPMANNRHAMLHGGTIRNLGAGYSGYMGQLTVHLAEAGFAAAPDALNTVYASVLGDAFDPLQMVDGLGSRWLLTEGYIKLYPTGRYSHAAMDALIDLLERLPGRRLDPQSVARIEVRTFRLGAMLEVKKVQNVFNTRFSIPFALASIIHHGRCGPDCFAEAAVANPAIQSLAQRTDVVEDPEFEGRYPREQIADLAIHLTSEQVLRGRCEVMRGEPGNPHDPRDLERKFHELTEPVLGRPSAQHLYEGLMSLERIADVRALTMESGL